MKAFFKRTVTYILTRQAAWLLKRHKPTIIAITGSVGKTTTKDAIYAAIKGSVHARKSEKSFNSDIGVPLTVLGLSNAWSNPFLWTKNIIDGFMTALFSKEYPEVLVLETGIDRPGDMAALTEWLKPDIAVLTRFPSVPVHVEYFSSPEAVVEEKMKLAGALKPDGVLIYNHDDDIIKAQLPNVLQKQIGYSRYLATDVTAADDAIVYEDNLPTGTKFTVKHAGTAATVRIKGTVGTHQVYSGTAALAVATTLGIDLTAAAESLSTLAPPPGRLRIIPGIKATTLIDDTYNSSPIATEQALQTLNELKYAKRKIAIIGDMLELGRFSTEEHEKVGRRAAVVADVLITVGVRARNVAEAALQAGMPEDRIMQYESVRRAGRELQNFMQPGDYILVKASQGIRAERIVEEVMAEPQDAERLLVRQSTVWRNKN
jgi:UDP-N-acetylmuramoyl-tripeptide--D-alanyl-D-alanine ligase